MEKKYVIMEGDKVIMSDLDREASFEHFLLLGAFANKELHIEMDGFFDDQA